MKSLKSIAVIGAGMSGLTCARVLRDHGLKVTVFEKSRGAGGRMSTRRADHDLRFDHGAQYFTVRDESFQYHVDTWERNGWVAQWHADIVVLEQGRVTGDKSDTARYVGSPTMNAACKHLAHDQDVRYQTRVAPLVRADDVWHLNDDQGNALGDFDAVVASAPAPQTAELVKSTSPQIASTAAAIPLRPCWALMLAFSELLPLDFGGAFVHSSPLSWIANNSSKPNRDASTNTWIAQASSDWSEKHLEHAIDQVQPELLAAFWEATGLAPQTPTFATSHRWRYSIPPDPLPERCLKDTGQRVVACGDWCGGPRVEGAFLSGLAAADCVLAWRG